MSIKVKPYILIAIAGIVLTGCDSYFYSPVPEPFTTNVETQKIDNEHYQDKMQSLVDKKFPKADVKIVSDHFNVLVIGEVESATTKVALRKFIKDQPSTRKVFDYTRISAKPDLDYSSSLVSKVKDRLKDEPDMDGNKVTVAAESDTVYLMGTNIGDLTHLARATKGIFAIDGVKKVINLVQPGPVDYYSGR